MPGYLGPYTGRPEKFAQDSMSEAGMACHMTNKGQQIEDQNICAGSMLFANKNCKSFRNPVLADAQRRLKEVDVQPEVLGYMEFIKRHESSLNLYDNNFEEGPGYSIPKEES